MKRLSILLVGLFFVAWANGCNTGCPRCGFSRMNMFRSCCPQDGCCANACGVDAGCGGWQDGGCGHPDGAWQTTGGWQPAPGCANGNCSHGGDSGMMPAGMMPSGPFEMAPGATPWTTQMPPTLAPDAHTSTPPTQINPAQK